MAVKIVEQSAEHGFLTALEKIKRDPAGWIGMRFGLSRKLNHDNMIENLHDIKDKIDKIHKRAGALADRLRARLEGHQLSGTIYHYHDGDVIALIRMSETRQRDILKALYEEVATEIGSTLCEYHNLARDIYLYQKLTDRKLVAGKLIEAYHDMSDVHKIESLSLRRKKREDPLILFVEDDRFTASYASNILSKEFDVIQAKTGEEAISQYIEHAPDMVFLDIHLPGISGHDTLKAMKRVDPEGYVVMLSVDAVTQNIVNASQYGASDFLKKPFSKDRLLYKAQRSPFIKADLTQFVNEEKKR